MPLLSGFHELFLKHYLLNLGVTPNLEYKDLLINKRVLTSSFNQVFNDFHSKTQLSPQNIFMCIYMVPGRFAPNPVRPLSRFAPIRVRPGSFRGFIFIMLL